VNGVPRVETFWGKGSLLVDELLYDKNGNVVGSDQPLVSPPEANDPAYTDCSAPQGFTENHFSSTVELLGG
jgi:hypothetical protein